MADTENRSAENGGAENRSAENRGAENRDVRKPDTERPDVRKPVVGVPAVPPPFAAAPTPARPHEAPSAPSAQPSRGIALLAQDERDKLTLRLQHAVTGFVDGPRDAVEEAEAVLAEVTERFTEAVARSRRTVRASWQSAADTGAGDTEQLRLALRDYRELAERMLRG